VGTLAGAVGTLVSVDVQRTPAEIEALTRLIQDSAMPALRAEPGATWERQGREHERLGNLCAALSWAQAAANRPPDNPYTVAGVEARVAAAAADEGPYVTDERIAEIRSMERARCKTTAVLWAEGSPIDSPETRAALGWLLGGACPVDEGGFTRGYRHRVA
jgi:hypothetical protein